MIRNIVLSGVGGQGILLAAKIIATAAELEGFKVAANEIHGMAQRGGSVTAQLRYGEEVYSPLVLEGTADVLASLESVEALRQAHYLKPEGLAVVSAKKIIPVTVSTGQAVYPADVRERLERVFPKLVYRDFEAEAEALGNQRLSNTVMLGALSAGLDNIGVRSWRKAMELCIKPQFVEMNINAFNSGRDAGKL